MKTYASRDGVDLYHGDAHAILTTLPSESVQCIVTSPPFWALRDYGVDGQIGLEATPDEWCGRLVAVFRECRRVLRDDGVMWLEVGDTYASSGGERTYGSYSGNVGTADAPGPRISAPGIKPKDLVGAPWMLAFALRADGWYLRSDTIWARPNPMPESVTDRPTKAHSYVFLLAKGQWKTRVVAMADLASKRVHLSQHVGPKNADSWANEFSVRIASAILDRTELKDQVGLAPLDSEVRVERLDGHDGDLVRRLPVEHRAAVLASRLLAADATPKEFLCEIDRMGVALSDDGDLLVLAGEPLCPLPPGVDRYGKTAVAIHDAGEIGELDFTIHTLKFSRPSGCSYFYDADAIREPNTDESIARAGRSSRYDDPAVRASVPYAAARPRINGDGGGRNARSVWSIATEPTPFAHFATFPQALVERCILAGTSERGACAACGAPWARQVERTAMVLDRSERTHSMGRTRTSGTMVEPPTATTTGWAVSCDCDADTRPCVVLDPFMGSGTTALVARRLGRHAVGIELNAEYLEIARRRLSLPDERGQVLGTKYAGEGQGMLDV